MGETRQASVDMDKGLERDLQEALGLLDDEEIETEEPLTDEDTPVDDEHEAPEEEDTPTEDDPEDHDPEYDVAGEKLKASQIQEWRKGYLRQGDYTRKTQELAEQRRQVEELQKRLQPLLAVEQYLASNPQAAAALQQIMQGGGMPQPGAKPQGRAGTYPRPPLQPQHRPQQMQGYGMYPALEQRLSRVEQLEQDRQLDLSLQSLRQTANAERESMGLPAMTDEQWNEVSHRVMNEALHHRISDLNQVYRMSALRDEWYREGLEKARETAIQEQAQRQRKKANAVIGGSPRGGSVEAPKQPQAKNLSDATRLAYRELKESGGSLFTD